MIKVVKQINKQKISSPQTQIEKTLIAVLPILHREELLLPLTDLMGYAVQEHPETENIATSHKLNKHLFQTFYRKISENMNIAGGYQFSNNSKDDISTSYKLTVFKYQDDTKIGLTLNIRDFAIEPKDKPRNLVMELQLHNNGEISFVSDTAKIIQKHGLLNLAFQGLLFYISDHIDLLLQSSEAIEVE